MAPCAFLCSLESVLFMDIYLSCVEIVLKFSSICEGKGSSPVSTHTTEMLHVWAHLSTSVQVQIKYPSATMKFLGLLQVRYDVRVMLTAI
jgi:hypothetical protein